MIRSKIQGKLHNTGLNTAFISSDQKLILFSCGIKKAMFVKLQ